MRRADDVFFFTLIDFLVQVFFFGLLLYVVAQVQRDRAEQERGLEKAQIKELTDAAGISTLTELTDYLTKLAPVKELKGMADFISEAGGLEEVKQSAEVVSGAGGAEEVVAKLARLQKLEAGTGKPPCLFDVVGGRRRERPLGRVEVTDTHVIFETHSSELLGVLSEIGASYGAVEQLTLADFRSRFAPLKTLRPQCRYHLDVRVSTELLAPMDAVWSAFSMSRRL